MQGSSSQEVFRHPLHEAAQLRQQLRAQHAKASAPKAKSTTTGQAPQTDEVIARRYSRRRLEARRRRENYMPGERPVEVIGVMTNG